MIFSYMIFVNHKSIDNEIVNSEINNNFTNIWKRNLESKENLLKKFGFEKKKNKIHFQKLDHILAKI